ncbi:PPE family protein [Mycobacterium bohemicum DSM 44277]|nr:PPE family protein [Mycobacterium bohemicum]CPR01430.1 PPE family protein [Mycobacterium bohemicum DSM 44277]
MTFPSFPWLPPEINSALMFAGAGSGPLFTAASAWDGLASDLAGAAASFQSVITGLTSGPWAGPASLQMAAAATPYVGWLNAAAGQAESAASQARAAATAFESALAGTIPTPAVTENRVQLLALIATNILGQNTPAIAMTEFEYMEMWAADVAAMFGYHTGALSVASALPSFSLPPLSLAGLSSLGSLVPSGLSSLASQAASLVGSSALAAPMESLVTAGTSEVSSLAANPSQLMSVAQIAMYPASMMMSPIMMAVQAGAHPATLADATSMAGADAAKFVGSTAPAAMKPLGGAGGLGALGAEAGLGKARLVGAMSVPPTWQGSAPARMVSSAMAGLGGEMPAGAAGAPMGGGMPMMPMPMGMGGAGAGMPGGMLGRGGASPNHVVQQRPSVVPRTGVG